MEFSVNVSVASLGGLLSTLKVSSKLVGRILRYKVTRNRGTFIYYYKEAHLRNMDGLGKSALIQALTIELDL